MIGLKIKLARKSKGLTQSQLGEIMGLSGSMIGQWENGLRKPKIETLVRIEKALDGKLFELNGININT